MRIYRQSEENEETLQQLLTSGSAVSLPEVEDAVRSICDDVKLRGDEAVIEFTHKWDSHQVSDLGVGEAEINEALGSVHPDVIRALGHAASNIREFHQAEKQQSWVTTKDSQTTLGQLVRPIDSVGLYIPGGRAAYPSTVLMTAIPASVAGVKRIAVASPPASDGKIPAIVLAACRIAGVTEVYSMGGAQAIAAFAYGTDTVGRVDKVCGPGNNYVNIAKRLLFGQIGIDSLAGPSEVLIIADDSVDPYWVAADLLAQAEHGGESKSLLITWDDTVAENVCKAVDELIQKEERADYIRQSLETAGAAIVTRNRLEAARLANICAAEHLQLLVASPNEWIPLITNAGAIFAGPYSPVPIGDYAAGPSHTLPTGAAARFSSALGVAEFQKRTSLIWYSATDYQADAQAAITIADAEGLTAHSNSLKIRFRKQDPS